MSEMAWMDYYVRGIGEVLVADVLATLDEEGAVTVKGTR
jgi:hypothetical protein